MPHSANILIVDDTPANLTVLSTMLTQEGYNVRPAISGEVALKAAHALVPDLILLDVQMPGMDGYEVCRQLKASVLTRNVPVIFISALDNVKDKVQAFEAGGVDYINKPFQILEVLARVQIQLTLMRQHRRLEALWECLPELQAVTKLLMEEGQQIDTANGLADTIRRLHAVVSQFSDTLT